MTGFNDRQPIIVADAGPLIRLAAAGLLDSLRGLNRRIVLVDRVEEEATADRSKPFAREIAEWIVAMGEAVLHARTIEGQGIERLRSLPPTPENLALLKRGLRDSGERAIREFVELHDPDDETEAIVVYEDTDTSFLLSASMVPLTMMTTRRFVQKIVEWGVNVDAVAALENIAKTFNLKPPLMSIVTPDPPTVK